MLHEGQIALLAYLSPKPCMTITVEVCLLAAGRTIAAIFVDSYDKWNSDYVFWMLSLEYRFKPVTRGGTKNCFRTSSQRQHPLTKLGRQHAELSVSTAELVPYTAKVIYKNPKNNLDKRSSHSAYKNYIGDKKSHHQCDTLALACLHPSSVSFWLSLYILFPQPCSTGPGQSQDVLPFHH